MSHFGELLRKLRKEKGLTFEAVVKKIGSRKGYVSGIENDKVTPHSVKIIKKYASVFGQDPRLLARLAWVDKAPLILWGGCGEVPRMGSVGAAPCANERPFPHGIVACSFDTGLRSPDITGVCPFR